MVCVPWQTIKSANHCSLRLAPRWCMNHLTSIYIYENCTVQLAMWSSLRLAPITSLFLFFKKEDTWIGIVFKAFTCIMIILFIQSIVVYQLPARIAQARPNNKSVSLFQKGRHLNWLKRIVFEAFTHIMIILFIHSIVVYQLPATLVNLTHCTTLKLSIIVVHGQISFILS